MPTSAEVRDWAAQQDPPLAKAGARGRLSKAATDAYNAAHATDPYSRDGKLAHILPVPQDDVQAVAEHPGTIENPSSHAPEFAEPEPDITVETAEPLQDAPSAHSPYQNPATDDDYSDGSDYEPENTPNVHFVDFSSEKYSEAP